MFVLPKEYKRGKIEEFAISPTNLLCLILQMTYIISPSLSINCPANIEIEDEERWRNVLES